MGLALLADRDVIRVSGEDSADYLQGQISQDVEALPHGVGELGVFP